MKMYSLGEIFRKDWLLLSIVALAFFLRVVGIGYGLPLALVNDEYPFTYAALQMMQSHALIPNMHPELFSDILPYPPYISYTLLLPFVVVVCIKFLQFHGSLDLFKAVLLSDLSTFFIIARFFNVVLGAFSVFLTYKIAERFFQSRTVSLAAGFLLATSILHIALSAVGRNWMPLSCVFLFILFVLTNRTWGVRRRYVISSLLAGIGMGISSASALALVLIGLYYLLFDTRSVRGIYSDFSTILLCGSVFVLTSAVPFFLWHTGGQVFLKGITFGEIKTFLGFAESPWSALSLMSLSEPVFTLLFCGGVVLLLIRARVTGFLLAGWFVLYAMIFYVLFRFDSRFLLPLLPVMAIAGGYCAAAIYRYRFGAIIVGVCLLLPLASSFRLSYLLMQGDTREYARAWILTHLSPADKVLVFSSGTHIPTQATAIAELRALDNKALRKVDEAEEVLNRRDVPYVLNSITSITNADSIKNLPGYTKAHGYNYALIEPRSLKGIPDTAHALGQITLNASIVEQINGFGDSMSIYDSAFADPFWTLFSDKLFGPDIVIYHLSPK